MFVIPLFLDPSKYFLVLHTCMSIYTVQSGERCYAFSKCYSFVSPATHCSQWGGKQRFYSLLLWLTIHHWIVIMMNVICLTRADTVVRLWPRLLAANFLCILSPLESGMFLKPLCLLLHYRVREKPPVPDSSLKKANYAFNQEDSRYKHDSARNLK